MKVAILYSAFAALSIAVNILTQIGVMALLEGAWTVSISVLAGTATGLVAKYLLDKRWIFAHVSRNSLDEAGTFARYTAMGILTTGIFWATELAFHILFNSDAMRYIGGIVGLMVGYTLKYRLDKQFVFTSHQL